MRRREQLLGILALAGSAISWWPMEIEPDLGLLSPWLPLALIGCATSCITLLSTRPWRELVLLSGIGSTVGLIGGMYLWPISDGIAASSVPVAFAPMNQAGRDARWSGTGPATPAGPARRFASSNCLESTTGRAT